jgi:hypothetical protein
VCLWGDVPGARPVRRYHIRQLRVGHPMAQA